MLLIDIKVENEHTIDNQIVEIENLIFNLKTEF